jgi:S1-C subfamily serine protease
VVDTSGQVVGMTTAASVGQSQGFGVQSGAGQGYAITIDNALGLVRQIEAGQSSATVHVGPRGVLGVEVTDGGAQGGTTGTGAYVDQVESNSPAAGAGITEGDTIVSVNGATVSSSSDLSDDLADASPGTSVTVTWTDTTGASHSATVTLQAGPPA